MERPDLYQDDLTQERYPTPAQRDDAAATQRLDPDASADDGNDRQPAPEPSAVAGKTALGYPGGVPGGVKDDPLGQG
ncbi:MAG: hypothetical protein NVS3B7_08210 [Candidatus Elarobacter sp.]